MSTKSASLTRPASQIESVPVSHHSLQTLPLDTSTTGTFAKFIQDSDALQIVGVAANISGILSSALAAFELVEGLGEPDNSTILNAIEALQQTLQSDFTQLGDLITEQAQLIGDTVNRDAMASALANSDVANARIQAFLAGTDNAALETAESESIAGVQFFNELNLSSAADLAFFLPGLVKAGTIRLFVIVSEPSSLLEPIAVIVDNVNSMVTLLGNMINAVTATVNAAHTVNEKSHVQLCSVIAQVQGAAEPALGQPSRHVTVIDGYFHEERGTALAFFDAQQGTSPCEQPSPFQPTALAAAQAARTQGVSDELAYIGIPNFQQILQAWTTFLATAKATPIPT